MKIRVSNERLWEISQAGENIDDWLNTEIGYEGFSEWFALSNLPYRSFEIYDEQKAMLFMLRWL